MQKSGFDIIGTHLEVTIDTDDNISELMKEIQFRLSFFERKYSRFVPENWLHTLNIERAGILDADGQTMLSTILDIAQSTDGYFDPTIAKRLTELGY
jgi:thiamine biosynthesis lipoprotein ApbE